MGLLNISLSWRIPVQEETAIISERECSKKSVQQGRSPFGARSVLSVREHGKMARTPLAAFFNIPSAQEGETMKTLANVMTTALQKIEAKANIIVASQKMRDTQIGSLVVVRHGELMRDQEEEIIGVISETDIIRKAVAQELNLADTPVDTMMSNPMITVEASWPLQDALDMMKDSGVRHLLVTQNHIVVGLVSLRDIIANLEEA